MQRVAVPCPVECGRPVPAPWLNVTRFSVSPFKPLLAVDVGLFRLLVFLYASTQSQGAYSDSQS